MTSAHFRLIPYGLLTAAFAAGCIDSSMRTNAATGGGSSASGGATADSGGSGGSAGSSNSSGGVSGGPSFPVGTISTPPAPPTSDVPEPDGNVTSPNLKVLPWAGFKAAITYTFDDSQPSQLEHWPELKAAGVPLTFFINPSNNYQANYDKIWNEVSAAGHEVANHTWTHCHADLSACTPVGTNEQEIDQTTSYIISNLGEEAVGTFASPFGETAWNKYAAPRFLVGRGVQGGFVPPSGTTDWYNLPAIGVTANQTAKDFNTSIDTARSQGRWGVFLYHSILPTANNWYAGVEIAEITASIDHAKSLEDVWVDTFIDIGAYARAQQVFEKLPAGTSWSWTLPDHFPKGGVLRVTVDGGSLSQSGKKLAWDSHGYYEVALDAGSLDWKQ